MLLKTEQDILFSKIIGLINGLYDDPRIIEIKDSVYRGLDAINKNEELDTLIQEFINLKEKYFSNCITCAFPCGRTSDYYINAQNNEEKVKRALYIASNYKNIENLFLEISKLSW